MNLPKQPENIEEGRQALAPYNFVDLPHVVLSLAESDLPDQDVFHPDRHTGEISCTLTTSSPLYVRAAQSAADFSMGLENKNSPNFFSTHMDGQPVIPGSSLRGMLRSLIEIVTFSKTSAVTNEPLVYRSVGEPNNHGQNYRARLTKVQAGYMHKNRNNDWYIQPAQEIRGTTWASIPSDNGLLQGLTQVPGFKNVYGTIYIQPPESRSQSVRGEFASNRFARANDFSLTKREGYFPAVVAYSGRMNNKKSEAVIYLEDKSAQALLIDEDTLRRYKEQITSPQEKMLGDHGVLNEGQPVFYLADPKNPDKVFFFGHCRMMRLPYPNSPRDMVPPALRDEATIDLAEAIFGFAKAQGEGKSRAYAGRVNISDAQLIEGQTNVWLNPRQVTTLKILGGPKPTTFQHYLVQTKPSVVAAQQKSTSNRFKKTYELFDYASNTPEDTVIRGHKLYWHKDNVSENSIAEPNKVDWTNDKQHTQVKPVRSGVQFRFCIQFENLSNVELGALLWVLEFGSNVKIRFSLGMGKPLGMGAVALQYKLTLRDARLRYASLLDGQKWQTGERLPDQVQAMSDSARQDYKKWMGLPPESSLTKLTRIRQLLMLLNWPGPDPSQTRYLMIEHPENKNEYKLRPVLPAVSTVFKKNLKK